VDGQIASTLAGDPTNWNAARDNASGSSSFPTSVGEDEDAASLSNQGSGNRIRINRAFFLFDTSTFDSGATIASANLQVYVTDKEDTENDGNDYVAVIATNPASTTDLVASDFDEVKGTDGNFPLTAGTAIQEQSSEIDIGNISTGTYNTFNLNAAGISNISRSGVSKFGVAEGHDIVDDPLSSSGQADSISISMSEHTGTSQDPKLVIVYNTPIIGAQGRKSFDQSITSSTTLTGDSELVVSLGANKTYVVDGVIFATSVSSTPNIKFGFDVPSGATMAIGYIAANGTSFDRAELLQSTSDTSGTINIAANTQAIIKVSGTV